MIQKEVYEFLRSDEAILFFEATERKFIYDYVNTYGIKAILLNMKLKVGTDLTIIEKSIQE